MPKKKFNMDEVGLARFCASVVDLMSLRVENMSVLRLIMDTQFVITQRFLSLKFLAYLCLFCNPLVQYMVDTTST